MTTRPFARILAVLAMTAFLTNTAWAQPARATILDRLGEQLELTEVQKASIADAVRSEDERPNAWVLAAALQNTLTQEQKELLFERGQKSATYMRGVRDGRRSRARARGVGRMQARVPRAQGTVARRAAPDEAGGMAEALNLTDAQRETIRIHRALTMAMAPARARAGQTRRDGMARRPRGR